MNSKNLSIYSISFLSGFLCIAVEIIWLRIITFAGMSAPQSFSFSIGMFLFGIAVGALLGREICKTAQVGAVSIGKIYLLAGVVDILLLLIAITVAHLDYAQYIFGLLVIVSAMVRGMVFPIIHHMGANSIKSGRAISNVYFANVLGCSIAPLVLTLNIFDSFTIQQTYITICVVTLIMSGYLLVQKSELALTAFGISFVANIGTLMIPESLISRIASNSYTSNYPAEKIIENKHGIIQLYKNKDPKLSDDILVFGNNAYDGRLNTDIFNDTNGIARSYLLATMNSNIKNVLVVGLSSGAWTEVLRRNPNIENITVVEINPAYIDLIEQHPIQSNILKDKRIKIVIDDGRKWIKNNQDKKFDLIVVNTTFHWRAYSSNLLSKEFLGSLKNIMNNKAVAYYNSTLSSDAYKTADFVFPHTYQHKYMIAVSKSPIVIDESVVLGNMCNLRMGKGVLFDSFDKCRKATQIALADPLVPYKDIQFNFAFNTPEIITDDNMLTEYKHGGVKTRKD